MHPCYTADMPTRRPDIPLINIRCMYSYILPGAGGFPLPGEGSVAVVSFPPSAVVMWRVIVLRYCCYVSSFVQKISLHFHKMTEGYMLLGSKSDSLSSFHSMTTGDA